MDDYIRSTVSVADHALDRLRPGNPITVIVHEARSLPEVQLFGTQSPYVSCVPLPSRGVSKKAVTKTRTITDGGSNPSWCGVDADDIAVGNVLTLTPSAADDVLLLEVRDERMLLDALVSSVELHIPSYRLGGGGIQKRRRRVLLQLEPGGLLDVSIVDGPPPTEEEEAEAQEEAAIAAAAARESRASWSKAEEGARATATAGSSSGMALDLSRDSNVLSANAAMAGGDFAVLTIEVHTAELPRVQALGSADPYVVAVLLPSESKRLGVEALRRASRKSGCASLEDFIKGDAHLTEMYRGLTKHTVVRTRPALGGGQTPTWDASHRNLLHFILPKGESTHYGKLTHPHRAGTGLCWVRLVAMIVVTLACGCCVEL